MIEPVLWTNPIPFLFFPENPFRTAFRTAESEPAVSHFSFSISLFARYEIYRPNKINKYMEWTWRRSPISEMPTKLKLLMTMARKQPNCKNSNVNYVDTGVFLLVVESICRHRRSKKRTKWHWWASETAMICGTLIWQIAWTWLILQDSHGYFCVWEGNNQITPPNRNGDHGSDKGNFLGKL